jgi:hypothetical protein
MTSIRSSSLATIDQADQQGVDRRPRRPDGYLTDSKRTRDLLNQAKQAGTDNAARWQAFNEL